MVLAVALYRPALRCGFINYDDPLYVTANVQVQKGLTWENIKWAFINPVSANWHPLTMLSHMLDCQLYGLKPWGHHLTSLLLHAVNVALVFVLLRQLTGAVWRSFWVAALFAVHPLRVESVAWIAERKDVLSGFFGVLTLILYARYVEQLKLKPPQVRIFYGLALIVFACGLMSKAMLVTWPFLMLLLDFWPLGRFKPGNAWQLVKEKIPFFGLAVLAGIMTLKVQQQGGAMLTYENFPFDARCENALIAYCSYLGKLFWPTDLAVLYPHPVYWPVVPILLAAGLILGATGLFWVQRRRYPYLLAGWLWYCGTLVPVIGLVQVGEQAMADRYTYLPSLGMLIAVVWGADELIRRWRSLLIPLSVAGGMVLILCFELTQKQIGYWLNSETLFRHALKVTKNNYVAHNNLGAALNEEGQLDQARQQYLETIRLKPNFVEAYANLGGIYDDEGQIDEAIGAYREAIHLRPEIPAFHHALGFDLSKAGRTDEAIFELQEALRLDPNDASIHNDLGNILDSLGRAHEAMLQFQEALRLKPDYAEAHSNLGAAYGKKGDMDDAILQFQEAIRLQPDNALAHYNLGNALEDQGQMAGATQQYQEALRLNPDFAQARANLVELEAKKTPADR